MLKKLIFLITIVLLASCIPNKDLVYLQGEPLKTNEIRRLNDAPYRLQVDDIILIEVMAQNDSLTRFFQKSNSINSNTSNANQSYESGSNLPNGYSVGVHGEIRLPYVGEINVLGFTTKEVRLKLEQLFSKYFKDLRGLFIDVKLAGIKYTIIGEITSPGPKVINQNRVSILDAVSFSGGIEITGDRKHVEVWRNLPDGQKRFTIDLTQATAFNSEIFYIQPNDIININPLPQKSWGTGTTGLQSLSTIITVFSLVTTTILLVRNL